MHAVVLFAHGARDPEWARPFEAIRDRVRRARPECPISLGYLELMKPSLEEAIDEVIREGASAITVFPLFMAQGSHLRRDLPGILDAIRAKRPAVPIALAPPIGEVPDLLDILAAWILNRLD